MFLRCTARKKDGKEHRYWNVVENRRISGGRVVQRQVLYLGEINDSQQAAWRKSIEVFEDRGTTTQMALFPEDRPVEISDEHVVKVRLKDVELRRPRQWGACWLACKLYEQLGLDKFFGERLPPGRKGTRWDLIVEALCCYQLIEPGSEWKLHRYWYEKSAMGDLLGAGFELAEIHKLYQCLDRLMVHKRVLFDHLRQRWKDLFNTKFDVLLYDLTSTYFESDPPFPEGDKRKHGYSRDKRFDCVQVVIALIVTPEGFPLAYEVLAGNTADRTTLSGFLKRIETQYGKAERIWVMDRGIPTEAVLEQMRQSDPPIFYLVGTPKGRLTRYEKSLMDQSWQRVREGVEVKLLAQEKEVYVLTQSRDRVHKERSMRRRQLKRLWERLHELARMQLTRDELLLKLGAARQQSPSAWRLVQITVPHGEQRFQFSLRKDKLRDVRRREGRYLLRTNLVGRNPAEMWAFYTQLVQVEEAFKTLKGDLGIRPIHHQKEKRIEAHIFVAFLAYALHVTLRRRLRDLAPGLTPRSVLEKFRSLQMIDVHLPTTDGRKVIMSRYTQPEPDLQMLIEQLRLSLPNQPRPRVTAEGQLPEHFL
jgi:hypothetical protein